MAKGTPADRTICFGCHHSTTPRTNIDLVGLAHRLRSEYGPGSVDSREVAEMLKAVDNDIEDYESEILLLQSRILYIQNQQTLLQTHAARLRSLNSPIRKVPNEILLRIFDLACERNMLQEFPWNDDFKYPPSMSIERPLEYLPAMSISSVCARWRSLALASSPIWSRISLQLSVENSMLAHAPSLLSGFLDTVKLHLHRSGQHPLSVSLDISGPADEEGLYEEDDIVPYQLLAFDLVCGHSWNTFGMGGSQPISYIPKFQFDSIRNCRALEHLAFTVSADQDEELKLFEAASGLGSLFLLRLGDGMPEAFGKEIWSLAVNSVDGDISNVFKYAPNPKELVLGEGSSISPCTPPRTCTSVSILKLASCHNESDLALTDAVLSSFTFPSLSRLIIMTDSAYPYQGAWPKANLEAFVRRSSCNLTEFEIQHVPVSDVDFIAALKLMPSLVHLRVDDTPAFEKSDDVPAGYVPTSPITPRFVRSLHGFLPTELNPSNSALIPKLRDLHLTFDGLDFDDAAFIDMVVSRWLPDTQYASAIGLSCLRVVTLLFNARAVDPEVYRPLECLDKAGMMVVVRRREGYTCGCGKLYECGKCGL